MNIRFYLFFKGLKSNDSFFSQVKISIRLKINDFKIKSMVELIMPLVHRSN